MASLAKKIRAVLTLDTDAQAVVYCAHPDTGEAQTVLTLSASDLDLIARVLANPSAWKPIDEVKPADETPAELPTRQDLETVLRAVLDKRDAVLGDGRRHALSAFGGEYYLRSSSGLGAALTFAEAVADAARVIRGEG